MNPFWKSLTLCAALALGVTAALPASAQTPPPGAAQESEDPDVKYAATLLRPGTPAPDFTLRDLDGRKVHLRKFRGKTIVLVFWATWCPDCRAEVPLLKKMQAEADPSKVVFVSVSFDRSLDKLRDYVREHRIGGVQLFEPAGKKDSAVGAAYGVRWIPSLCLIGADGRVILSTVVAQKVADRLNTIK